MVKGIKQICVWRVEINGGRGDTAREDRGSVKKMKGKGARILTHA